MNKNKKSHKSPSNLKSQAALEFLVTYSWALLAILITIGALYYYGIFDFGKYLPEKCLFTSQLECLDFIMKGDKITFRLVNNLGEPIDVNSVDINNDATPALNCNSAYAIFIDGTAWDETSPWAPTEQWDFEFSGCSGGGFIEDERVEAIVTLKYCSPATTACPEHTVNGKIEGRVQ